MAEKEKKDGAQNFDTQTGKTLPELGNLFTPQKPIKTLNARLLSYQNIYKLHEAVQSERGAELHFATPTTVEAFEMLEAELVNQGILPKATNFSSSLSQYLVFETSIIRWQARRGGLSPFFLEFLINIPYYIVEKAEELMAIAESVDEDEEVNLMAPQINPWRINSRDLNEIKTKLRYLDRFASYILGHFEEPSSKYQKGLNALLRLIKKTETSGREKFQALTAKEPFEKITIVLPQDKKTLLKKFKEISVAQ